MADQTNRAEGYDGRAAEELAEGAWFELAVADAYGLLFGIGEL